MDEIYEKELETAPSVCDASGRLSYHGAFGLFMDAASSHADRLGIGIGDLMKKNLFWLTVKTRVEFISRPRLGKPVIVRTWPEAPEKVRGDRSYELEQDGEVIIRGKTEWTVADTVTRRFAPIKEIYPDGLSFARPSACPGPFARIPEDFEENDRYFEHTVLSTDIDVGGHMNNTAYVRAVIGSFSNAELRSLDIRRIDVVFRASCFEGDRLIFQKRAADGGINVRVSRGGETVLLMRIETGGRTDINI